MPTQALVKAVCFVAGEPSSMPQALVRTWWDRMQREMRLHFGWPDGPRFADYLATPTAFGTDFPARYLDAIEIMVDTAPSPGALEKELNRVFERHRFAYRLQDRQIHSITSPALEAAVVGPALLAVQRPGWEEVGKNYREALSHQLGPEDENDDALTAANAALESALKAMGLKGNHPPSVEPSRHAHSQMRILRHSWAPREVALADRERRAAHL